MKAQDTLRQIWHTDLAGVVLYWDGHEIMARKWDDVYALIQQPGQSAIHMVAASVAAWKIEAEAIAVEVDVDAIQRHRKEYRERNPKGPAPTSRIGSDEHDDRSSRDETNPDPDPDPPDKEDGTIE